MGNIQWFKAQLYIYIFLSNLCKNDLDTVLGRNLFSIANDCSVNPSDLSKMLVKKQMKYFDVPLEHHLVNISSYQQYFQIKSFANV